MFYNLLSEKLGVHLADAAAPMANPTITQELCLHCGFDTVEVSTFSGREVYYRKQHALLTGLSDIAKVDFCIP